MEVSGLQPYQEEWESLAPRARITFTTSSFFLLLLPFCSASFASGPSGLSRGITSVLSTVAFQSDCCLGCQTSRMSEITAFETQTTRLVSFFSHLMQGPQTIVKLPSEVHECNQVSSIQGLHKIELESRVN